MSNNKECQFEVSTNTSSATICKWCGQEKWQHNTIMSNNKQSMKLYTEIQVIEAIDKASLPNMTIFDILENLTPIELPSDEEIENYAIMNNNITLLEAAKPLIKYLNDNYHPMCTAIVTLTNVEILEGIECDNTDEFLKD